MAVVPKVTPQTRRVGLLVLLLAAFCFPLEGHADGDIGASPVPATAASLYEQLQTVGLDGSRVYHIREASIDRASLHISLNDGTIAFTKDVAGRVTGAFFAGDGEVLLSPPDQVERASMALFTGAAILEETFTTAYLRFNDDTFKKLNPFLKPFENSEAFLSQWNDNARNLAEGDALRLLSTFCQFLPAPNLTGHESSIEPDPEDRMLHLRVQGRKLGIFDLFFDLKAKEQIAAGQFRRIEGKNVYDVWTSFSLPNRHSTPAAEEIAGQEKDDEIEVSHFNIRAEIKPPRLLQAEARLRVLIRRSGARLALFELSRFLKIQTVEADGRPIEFIHNQALEGTQLERRGDDLVAVVFPQPLRSGQSIELRFVYEGTVLSDVGGGLLYVGARGTWYPNRGFLEATFDMEFRYPPGWTLVATGNREGVASADASTQASVTRWIAKRPIPIAGFNLGRYSHVENRSGPVAVDVYAASGMERGFPQPVETPVMPKPSPFPWQHDLQIMPRLPPSPARNAQSVADDAARAVSFFSGRFGPYPYNSLAVTQMPGTMSQGWPGLIFLSSFAFLSAEQKSAIHMSPVQLSASDGVIAHEIAHQWWGDLVHWSSYRDQWIDEALANYSSLLFMESQHPDQFRELMEKYRDDLLHKNKNGLQYLESGPVTLGVRLNSSKFSDGYETIAYERGTWLFHMLRTAMRDAAQSERKTRRGVAISPGEPFLAALREVRERYQGRPVSTVELLHVFEKHLPPSVWHEGRKSLDWFYEGWVNGTSIPEIELHAVKYVDKANSTLVSGTIQQKDASDDLITSVPLYAVANGKSLLAGRIFADGKESQFHLLAPLGTRKVVLDPNHTILSRFH